LRAELLTPFLADVQAARSQALLEPKDLAQTSMAMALDALLLAQENRWTALLPLTAPQGVDIQADKVRAALMSADSKNVLFVDMKAESDHLYAGYLHEATLLSLGGFVAIVGLLLLVFRSPTRVLRIIAPLAAAVITVTAGLALWGQQLIILHLVGLLLVVAVGSNYALFLIDLMRARRSRRAPWPRCCLPISPRWQALACWRFPRCPCCRPWASPWHRASSWR
jgi:predicted exporter